MKNQKEEIEESNMEECKIELKNQKEEIEESNMEEWKIELKNQKEEIEEEVGPIIKLSNEGKLSYDEYLEKLLQALERAKEKYCKRHDITKEEYDKEEKMNRI